jgi:DNA-binding transcriptional LysR family regulator
MADTLSLLQTFVRTVEAGSFTAVARQMRASQPTVSRQIAALEDHLGCLLIRRTTRALTLTDEGRVFYDHALRVLEAATEAEGSVGRRRGRATGRLRLACSGVFGRLHVIPHLPAFMAEYPEVEIDLTMQDRFVDLVEDGIDLAIRLGEVTDPGLIARRIGSTRRRVLATPGYLAAHGTPQHPDDLTAHRCIVYTGLAAGQTWAFATPQGPLSVDIAGSFQVDSTEGVRAAVLAGLGIAYIPTWHFVAGEIERGDLSVLLDAFAPPPQPISAVWASRRHLSPKVRAAIDHFAAAFAADPRLGGAPVAGRAGSA